MKWTLKTPNRRAVKNGNRNHFKGPLCKFNFMEGIFVWGGEDMYGNDLLGEDFGGGWIVLPLQSLLQSLSQRKKNRAAAGYYFACNRFLTKWTKLGQICLKAI